MDFGMYLNSL